jgi:hypothetical protein
MKANENTVGHAADSDDNLDKKSKPGAPFPSSCIQPDEDATLRVSAGWDAKTATIPFGPAIFGMEVDPNKFSDDSQDEDAPKENLF